MISRNLTEEDKPLLAKWIAQEPSHNHTPAFYSQEGTKSVMYEDEEGEVLALKFTPCLRLDIEFSPTAGRARIAKAMTEEFPKLVEQAKTQGFKEFVFESSSTNLIAFCEKLGYTASPDFRKVF
jgi:hypothetical protein